MIDFMVGVAVTLFVIGVYIATKPRDRRRIDRPGEHYWSQLEEQKRGMLPDGTWYDVKP